MVNSVVLIVAALAAAGVGGIAGYIIRKRIIDVKLINVAEAESKIANAKKEAEDIKKLAEKEAENIKKEIELKAKETALKLKEDAEKEIKDAKREISNKEQRILQKEENLDRKVEKLEVKEKELDKAKDTIELKKQEIENIKVLQDKELEKISQMSKDEAKGILLHKLENELTHEKAVMIREYERKLNDESDKLAKKVISTAIGKAASEYVVEATISVVQLPNDEMKGRIIGREGRNIRTIESLTGVDVIIDDTPEAVVLSCFDPVKREIAKLTIEKLIQDGRIHPAKIEEAIEKSKKEVAALIQEAGEQAVLELGLHGVHSDIIKTIGKLRYRTSYGQNVLIHSIEVGHLAAVMAAEIGANVELAKRGALFHDIGKALDHDLEGTHTVIGAEFLKRYKESEEVLNCIMAHHGEEPYKTVEAVLVQAADAVSASRPGARRESLENYLKRLESLEKIANETNGVETSFAIQAGREIRIIVKPDEIDDDKATTISRDVAKKIEETMQYPGQIKVTVIRETRSVEYAK